MFVVGYREALMLYLFHKTYVVGRKSGCQPIYIPPFCRSGSVKQIDSSGK